MSIIYTSLSARRVSKRKQHEVTDQEMRSYYSNFIVSTPQYRSTSFTIPASVHARQQHTKEDTKVYLQSVDICVVDAFVFFSSSNCEDLVSSHENKSSGYNVTCTTKREEKKAPTKMHGTRSTLKRLVEPNDEESTDAIDSNEFSITSITSMTALTLRRKKWQKRQVQVPYSPPQQPLAGTHVPTITTTPSQQAHPHQQQLQKQQVHRKSIRVRASHKMCTCC